MQRKRDRSIDAKLDRILHLLETLIGKEERLMQNLAALTSQVEANTSVEASAVLLINGIAAQLAAVSTDPVAVQALADKLKASSDTLAAAVAANTPAATT